MARRIRALALTLGLLAAAIHAAADAAEIKKYRRFNPNEVNAATSNIAHRVRIHIDRVAMYGHKLASKVCQSLKSPECASPEAVLECITQLGHPSQHAQSVPQMQRLFARFAHALRASVAAYNDPVPVEAKESVKRAEQFQTSLASVVRGADECTSPPLDADNTLESARDALIPLQISGELARALDKTSEAITKMAPKCATKALELIRGVPEKRGKPEEALGQARSAFELGREMSRTAQCLKEARKRIERVENSTEFLTLSRYLTSRMRWREQDEYLEELKQVLTLLEERFDEVPPLVRDAFQDAVTQLGIPWDDLVRLNAQVAAVAPGAKLASVADLFIPAEPLGVSEAREGHVGPKGLGQGRRKPTDSQPFSAMKELDEFVGKVALTFLQQCVDDPTSKPKGKRFDIGDPTDIVSAAQRDSEAAPEATAALEWALAELQSGTRKQKDTTFREEENWLDPDDDPIPPLVKLEQLLNRAVNPSVASDSASVQRVPHPAKRVVLHVTRVEGGGKKRYGAQPTVYDEGVPLIDQRKGGGPTEDRPGNWFTIFLSYVPTRSGDRNVEEVRTSLDPQSVSGPADQVVAELLGQEVLIHLNLAKPKGKSHQYYPSGVPTTHLGLDPKAQGYAQAVERRVRAAQLELGRLQRKLEQLQVRRAYGMFKRTHAAVLADCKVSFDAAQNKIVVRYEGKRKPASPKARGKGVSRAKPLDLFVRDLFALVLKFIPDEELREQVMDQSRGMVEEGEQKPPSTEQKARKRLQAAAERLEKLGMEGDGAQQQPAAEHSVVQLGLDGAFTDKELKASISRSIDKATGREASDYHQIQSVINQLVGTLSGKRARVYFARKLASKHEVKGFQQVEFHPVVLLEGRPMWVSLESRHSLGQRLRGRWGASRWFGLLSSQEPDESREIAKPVASAELHRLLAEILAYLALVKWDDIDADQAPHGEALTARYGLDEGKRQGAIPLSHLRSVIPKGLSTADQAEQAAALAQATNDRLEALAKNPPSWLANGEASRIRGTLESLEIRYEDVDGKPAIVIGLPAE